MMKKYIKRILIVLLVILIIVIGYRTYRYFVNTVNDVKFSRIIDGDSFYLYLNGKEIECRLIGIDTPEVNKSEDYAKEAKYFTQDLLSKANKIKVEYDDNTNHEDNYGRHLVYVFVDDKLLQSEILKQGYGKVAYVYANYKYLNEMKRAEIYARDNALNVWKSK